MSLDKASPEGSGNHRFVFFVNGERFTTNDPVIQGCDILAKAGFDPASEHVLVQLLRPGAISRGLDEDIPLSEDGPEHFHAFASDRTFNFTVDERGYEWGAAVISEAELREVVGIGEQRALFFEHEDEPDEMVEPGAEIDLSQRGTEHLRTGKRLITVYYAEEPKELERGIRTGAQLAAIFGVPEGYIVDLIKPNGEFTEIGSEQPLKLRDGMRFASHPPSGQSA
jgi:hypothetical protein